MGCRGGPAVGDALRRWLVAGLRVPMTPTDVARAAEHAVRASYGRLMAVLSAQTHDLAAAEDALADALEQRSEEHTSELQSLMRISYAVFCLKKKKEK